MGIAEGKTDEYRSAAEAAFRAVRLDCVGATIDLDGAGVENAVLMGPNAGRFTGRALAAGQGTMRVTCDIQLLFAVGPRH